MKAEFRFIKTSHLIILGILLFGNVLYSQNPENKNNAFFEHVRFGGSIGLNFGDGYFSANLSPKAVYDFNRTFSAGIGLLGAYTNGRNYNAIVYGGSLIGLIRPLRAIRLSAEFEELHVNRDHELIGGNIEENYWYPALFLGIGYTSGHVTVGVRYDLLYDDQKSIYGSAFMPFVSVYF